MLWCWCIIQLNIAIIIRKHQDVYGNITEMIQIIFIKNSESFKFKVKITGKSPATGNTKDVKITVTFKYLSNFWRTLEML